MFLALHLSVQNYRVEGPSMEPTLQEGQFLFVNKLAYLRLDLETLSDRLPFLETQREEPLFRWDTPSRGEVVVFKFPDDETRDFVKRVIGVPGDSVRIEEGVVYVNGEKLDEPYVTRRDRRNMTERDVLPGTYFVLGDNRASSHDSRDWGAVPAENIIGRTWVRYWPLDQARILQAFGAHQRVPRRRGRSRATRPRTGPMLPSRRR